MVENIHPVENPEPAAALIVDDLEALKVLSHPLRLEIMDLLTDEPRTVKQIAASLEISPNKLYYHVNLLEKHGFIKLVEVRIVSGILEKHYRASAYEITVKDGLLKRAEPGGEEEITALVESVLDRAKGDITAALRVRALSDQELQRSQMILLTKQVSMTKERALEFSNQLKDLAAEFEQGDEEIEQGSGQKYTLTTLLYPVFAEGTSQAREDNASE